MRFLNSMFRVVSVLALISTLFLIQGCASTTKWKVDAVEPSRKGVVPKSIKIGKFSSRNHNDGATFSGLLTGKLQAEGFVDVQQRGAEGHISGSISWGKTKRDTWKDSYEYKDKTNYIYYAKIQKSLTVSYVLNVGGKTYSDTYVKNYSKEKKSSENYSEAKADLRTEESIQSKLMQKIASEIARDITPYRVKKTYKIKLGDSDNLALGADYLKIDRQDQAMEIFRQIANKTKNDEDRAAAIYNQGVIYEARGDLEKAFNAYRDANQLNLEEMMYPKAVSRLELARASQEKLNKQLESLDK